MEEVKVQHVCGTCNKTFTSEEDYIAHTCEITGFTPADQEHLGEDFAHIAEAAQLRGKKTE